MLMRIDPFQVFDRMTQQWSKSVMQIDAYRANDYYVVHLDLPGVSPESIDLDVQNSVLTVKAERTAVAGDNVEVIVSERPTGTFSRQLFLGDNLDADRIDASYDAGVLTLRIPIVEQAKPRKIAITSGERQAIDA